MVFDHQLAELCQFRNNCRGMKLACGPSNFDDNFDNSDLAFFIRWNFFDHLQDQLLTPQLLQRFYENIFTEN